MDNEALDAPVYNLIPNKIDSELHQHVTNNEFTSLPCEAISMSHALNSSENYGEEFSYSNPVYQSAQEKLISKTNSHSEDTCYIDGTYFFFSKLFQYQFIL